MPGLESLFACSFRKVPFLWQDETRTTGGRKTVTHEFVNSNFRATEDLGPQLKTYSIRGIVAGEDFIDQRDRLLAALDTPGKGILVHPTFGRVEVVAKPYTVIEADTELGRVIIDMVFEKAEETILPQPAVSGVAEVSSISGNLNNALEADTAGTFNVTNLKPNSFRSGLQTLNGYANKLRSVTELFSGPIDAVSRFSSTLDNFQQNVTDLVSAPSRLANQIKSLNDQMNTLFDAPADQLKALASLFGYKTSSAVLLSDVTTSAGGSKELLVVSENLSGGFDPIDNTLDDSEALGNALTDEEAEIISNEKVVTRQIRMTALSNAYAAGAQIEFGNIEELDTTAGALEDQFQIMNEDEDIPIDTRELLLELRNAFERLLDDRRLSIKRVSEVSINTRPAQVLAYQLYGDSSLTRDLIDLGELSDVSHVSGTVKVLTQ